MKTSSTIRFKRGFVSYLLVLSSGAILTLLMLAAYRRAIASQVVQGQVQLRVDYSEKEEAILRSIVGNVSNAAINVMQVEPITGQNDWPTIIGNALAQTNASNSIRPVDAPLFNIPPGAINANTSDNATTPLAFATVMRTIPRIAGTIVNSGTQNPGAPYPAVWLGAGVNIPLPPVLTTSAATSNASASFPIIQPLALIDQKSYAEHAVTYAASNPITASPSATPRLSGFPFFSKFNQLDYPNIKFRYTRPGSRFVAKRHWWTFSIDTSQRDATNTNLMRADRQFVLSIYEVPSQTPISAIGAMSIGQYANGQNWGAEGVTALATGNIYAKSAVVNGGGNMRRIATRNGLNLANAGGTIGGQAASTIGFQAGDAETADVQTPGLNPSVTRVSESGRTAFISLNNGPQIYNRHDANAGGVNPSPWQKYTSPAQQCAMQLDITSAIGAAAGGGTRIAFSYLLANGTRSAIINLVAPSPIAPTIPGNPFQMTSAPAGQGSANFQAQGMLQLKLAFIPAFLAALPVVDPLLLDPTFAVPAPGIPASTKSLGGASFSNNSLVVNVAPAVVPAMPAAPTYLQPGIVLAESCANLAGPDSPAPGPFNGFDRGFSLVTNMMLYVNANVGTKAMPTIDRTALNLPVDELNQDNSQRRQSNGNPLPTVPACNLFSPVKRYGFFDAGPMALTVEHIGQVASTNSTDLATPLDTARGSGLDISTGTVLNLSSVYHPGNLPPINLMNWLIVLDEIGR